VAVVAVVDEGRERRAPQGVLMDLWLRERRAPQEQLHLRDRGVTGGKIRKQVQQGHGLRGEVMAALVAR
jgi:hypothetical protein